MKYLISLVVLIYILLYLLRLQYPEVKVEPNLFEDSRLIISNRIKQLLPSPQAELLSGILLGEKQQLPFEFQLALRDTSTLHMVVVSGQNITLLSGVILGVLAGLIKRRSAILITLFVVIGYVLLTGAQIPVLRAALMAGIVFLAEVSGRQKNGVIALLASGLILLLINPSWFFSLSFQLSFLATFGVVVVAPILNKTLFKVVPDLMATELSVTFAAQLMVLPIIASSFHQLSLVGVLANLLVGWTVPFIMIIGAVVLAISFVSFSLAALLSWIVNVFLTFFVYIVEIFAGFPFAWGYVGDFPWVFWLGYYILIAGMLQWLYAQTKTARGPQEEP